MKLVNTDQMRQIDRDTIDHQNISGEVLMENAGAGIALRILETVTEQASGISAAIFCGKGNNGGDGYVIARHLHNAGVEVSIYHLGSPKQLTEDAALNFNRAIEAGLSPVEIKSSDDLPIDLDVDIVVDAIFGTGFTGAPRDLSTDMIDLINSCDAEIISVDIPSGLNADNGQFEGAVIQADCTFCLALPKFGLFVSPGRELSGFVDVVPIGIPSNVIDSLKLATSLITRERVADYLLFRPPDGHKGTFGKLFTLAGSTGMTGAVAMCATSALRSGCGMVKIGTPKSVQPVVATLAIESVSVQLPDVGSRGKLALRGHGEIRKLIEQHDACVIGPGIGQHHETTELIRRLVSNLERPAVIDADGLNALSKDIDILKSVDVPLVLTPHEGEFERLFGKPIPSEIEERIATVIEIAREYSIVLVMKGSPTLIGTPDGECFFNPTGNQGMATGGSGDVLSGIIGSFLAQGMETTEAAIAGVFVHGMAGDFIADIIGPRSLIASDMIDALPEVFSWLE